MNLKTLERFDQTAVDGILAAAALASAPDPGVGERPLVLREYEKEANEVLSEIRARLKISKETDPIKARASVSEALAHALRNSILSHVNKSEVLARMGRAGELPLAAYNVVQNAEFRKFSNAFGVSRRHIEQAVKHPDDHQHLMTEAVPNNAQDMSLFMKSVMSHEAYKRHWLLVQSHRAGVDQHVTAAWKVYPDEVDLKDAREPLDALKAFVNRYGIPVIVGNLRGLFVEPQAFKVGVPVKIDWTGAPKEHFLSSLHTTTADGIFRIGITYCIDLGKYRTALKAHGARVTPSGPNFPTTLGQLQTDYHNR